MRIFAVHLLSLMTIFLSAGEQTSAFPKKQLGLGEGVVYAVSSFSQIDYFTAFSREGQFLWEIPTSTEIVSWKKDGDELFLLSKLRNDAAFYLTCIHATTGEIIWEKGIFAPGALTQDSNEEPKSD